ncbi:MAG: DDE-type integrase/transposase/recombinase [Sideroxydans sp.]|nr:DDE-type integrase/transposase/recombinase [Sideroxydans sp.]
MEREDVERGADRWARFRFSIVGPLLSSPPGKGELGQELSRLAAKTWQHPIDGGPFRPAARTLETWYYQAREQRDPVTSLRRKRRADSGRQRAIPSALGTILRGQYQEHPGWSAQLHRDNLAARVRKEPALGPCPSYSSVRRFLRSQGLTKKRRPRRPLTEGEKVAEARLAGLEVRGYEAEFVSGLWHLDFHHGSRPVLTSQGRWETPMLLGILDDRSRLCCHAQWYLGETAEDLVHGVRQALLKRDLPRALMTDNGAAMIAAETTQGLERLGILHEKTLPYSPYQNGKQESFWGQVEGRLMAMLEGHRELTLSLLNEATQAWLELEYNRKLHSETGQEPLERFLQGPSVARPCPDPGVLDLAFLGECVRTQRRSDGTVSIEARRFEVPSRFRHLRRVFVRYARWDLSRIVLVDEHSGTVLSPIYPVDLVKNASGQRRPLLPEDVCPEPASDGIAPLLRQLMEDYAATGLPPAYLPKTQEPA